MKIPITIIALTLLCVTADAGKAPASAIPKNMNLQDACKLALRNNPGISYIREQTVQQDGVLKEAKATRLPHLTASGTYETFDEDRLQSFGDGFSVDSTRWNTALNASMTVFSGGRNNQYVKGQEAISESIKTDVKVSEDDLLVLVHIVYYQAWLADQQVKVQKEAISVFEEQLQVTKNMFNSGVGEKFDVTQAQVALANARPPMIRAMNNRRRSVDHLQEIIGLPYPAETDASKIKIETLSAFTPPEIDLKNAIKNAMTKRQELKSLEHNIEAAYREVKYVKSEISPTVDVFAGYGMESDMFGESSSLEGWSSGITMKWNLVDGGARRAKVQQAKSKVRQTEHQSTKLMLSIQGEVRKAYYDQQEASAIFEVSAKVIEQAKEALKLSQNRYKAGKGTQLEILESQLQLTRAQLEQSKARHDLELASIQMRKATGEKIIQQ